VSNYWVVGAMLAGEDDQFDKFIRRGMWRRRFDKDDPQAKLLDQIRTDDRIAIKRMLGTGATEIEIRAIGIVKDIDSDKRVYVNWLLGDLERKMSCRNYFGSIHGPLHASDDWVKEAFMI
jgi:hypothetical protein